jgi:aminoglycoside phosphotransferase (APT) family kinase protein
MAARRVSAAQVVSGKPQSPTAGRRRRTLPAAHSVIGRRGFAGINGKGPRLPATGSEQHHEVGPLLDVDVLTAELDRHGLGFGPVNAEPLGDGHSNITFLIRRGDAAWVLRRPPRPPFPPSAHDVLREHRMLSACAGHGVRTPRPLFACTADATAVGVPYYVMEHVDGHVLTTSLPAELDAVEERRRIGSELIDALVEIHAVDPAAPEFARFGKPSGYLDRQLRLFASLWDRNRTRDVAAVDDAGRLLAERRPASGPSTLVHGDFRLGNMLFARRAPARLTAVIDWEMATVGDPLADLGYLTATWAEPGDDAGALLELGTVTALPGFHSRAELVSLYERRSGREAAATNGWYEALACWKSAVFLEGSYRRLLDGTTDDPFFAGLERGVPELAERALASLERS